MAPGANHRLAYAVNGLNQYVSVDGNPYVHDANGNLTSDGTTSYVYDGENRLVSASGFKTVTLHYDPLGRLAKSFGGAEGHRQFLYDGDALVAEYDGSGNLLKRYVHSGGVDEPVAVYEGPALGLANRAYHQADERGSIIALVNADGTLKAINRYDEWGVPAQGNQGSFQYTGQRWIPDLGMYYYKARIYSPMLGRFMQTDPIGYEGGINLYAYVNNDPLNLRDPSGNNPDCAPQCFEQVRTRTQVDIYRDLVDADAWEESFSSLAEGNYAAALGSALQGAMAVAGISPPGRITKPLAVIGHYSKQTGGYITLAQKLGARFFQMPMQTWEKMTPAQQWAANQRFLDRQIRDGAEFRLSTRAQDAKPGSSFAREIEHLKKNGYEISRDGYRMTKKPCNTASSRLCP